MSKTNMVKMVGWVGATIKYLTSPVSGARNMVQLLLSRLGSVLGCNYRLGSLKRSFVSPMVSGVDEWARYETHKLMFLVSYAMAVY